VTPYGSAGGQSSHHTKRLRELQSGHVGVAGPLDMPHQNLLCRNRRDRGPLDAAHGRLAETMIAMSDQSRKRVNGLRLGSGVITVLQIVLQLALFSLVFLFHAAKAWGYALAIAMLLLEITDWQIARLALRHIPQSDLDETYAARPLSRSERRLVSSSLPIWIIGAVFLIATVPMATFRGNTAAGRIGTEHILLGLLRDEGGIAALALVSLGVTLDRALSEIADVVPAAETRSDGQMPLTRHAKRALELAAREG
jgi:hypothetical protein